MKGEECPKVFFKQVSLDILRLHQQTIRSLIATKCCDECEVHDAVFITLDGRYYVWLPCGGKSPQSETGILLIEDEDGNTRLSWVAGTRSQTKTVYTTALFPPCKEKCSTKNKFIQSANARLLELTPQQDRLTTNSKDFSLSPHDLMKALYPANIKWENLPCNSFLVVVCVPLRPLKF